MTFSKKYTLRCSSKRCWFAIPFGPHSSVSTIDSVIRSGHKVRIPVHENICNDYFFIMIICLELTGIIWLTSWALIVICLSVIKYLLPFLQLKRRLTDEYYFEFPRRWRFWVAFSVMTFLPAWQEGYDSGAFRSVAFSTDHVIGRCQMQHCFSGAVGRGFSLLKKRSSIRHQ